MEAHSFSEDQMLLSEPEAPKLSTDKTVRTASRISIVEQNSLDNFQNLISMQIEVWKQSFAISQLDVQWCLNNFTYSEELQLNREAIEELQVSLVYTANNDPYCRLEKFIYNLKVVFLAALNKLTLSSLLQNPENSRDYSYIIDKCLLQGYRRYSFFWHRVIEKKLLLMLMDFKIANLVPLEDHPVYQQNLDKIYMSLRGNQKFQFKYLTKQELQYLQICVSLSLDQLYSGQSAQLKEIQERLKDKCPSISRVKVPQRHLYFSLNQQAKLRIMATFYIVFFQNYKGFMRTFLKKLFRKFDANNQARGNLPLLQSIQFKLQQRQRAIVFRDIQTQYQKSNSTNITLTKQYTDCCDSRLVSIFIEPYTLIAFLPIKIHQFLQPGLNYLLTFPGMVRSGMKIEVLLKHAGKELASLIYYTEGYVFNLVSMLSGTRVIMSCLEQLKQRNQLGKIHLINWIAGDVDKQFVVDLVKQYPIQMINHYINQSIGVNSYRYKFAKNSISTLDFKNNWITSREATTQVNNTLKSRSLSYLYTLKGKFGVQ